MRIKKRRKNVRYRGFSTAKRGKKNRTRGSGNQGGVGMSGTGKRGDQKKSLVIKLTGGNNYFGKDKTLRKGHVVPKLQTINLYQISRMKPGKDGVVDLKGYKILGDGELGEKLKIKASKASSSAVEKIKKSGSELTLDISVVDTKNKLIKTKPNL